MANRLEVEPVEHAEQKLIGVIYIGEKEGAWWEAIQQ